MSRLLTKLATAEAYASLFEMMFDALGVPGPTGHWLGVTLDNEVALINAYRICHAHAVDPKTK